MSETSTSEFPDDAILVVLEHLPSAELEPAAAGLLAAAAKVGTPVALIDHESLAEKAAQLGASRVLVAEYSPASEQPADSTAQDAGSQEALGLRTVDAVEQAVAAVRPDAVLLSHSLTGRDVAGRYAARTRTALCVNAVGISRDEQGIIAEHSAYGGSYAVTSAATLGAPVITLRRGAFPNPGAPAQAEPSTAAPEIFPVQTSQRRGARVLSYEPRTEVGARPSLPEAARVVAGGRGVGEQHFELVEQLAEVLDAAVGASRGLVEDGVAPASAQVGETGASISPQLYLALGISGMVQHQSGLGRAQTIVAINNDAEAPIFELADFGVVGSVSTVVPQLISALKAREQQ